ncbi:MAG TPA: DNA methyltransferase, partial [Candidatus Pacebacteria bacterium]|nr:DNA methyltransferase [Candidatus Paceibacterota bacterium]
MVASYTIAHIKLGLVLQETGVEKLTKRLGIYLTNSLDAPSGQLSQESLFGLMESIANESFAASGVKRDYPVMVVVGNPPYSGISQNKQFTDNAVYKVEPGGKEKLQEHKNWLDDDYVKFIRLAESLVEKNQEGIIGLITAHGYIDNPTFRGMRWHLRETFDEIYVLDLHGNSNKKEVSPDGSKDENVFDIKTGVSIILGVKLKKHSSSHKSPATVYKGDLFGLREEKFEFLNSHDVHDVGWEKLPTEAEVWRKIGNGDAEYREGFSVFELFPISSTGIVTARDSVVIDQNKENLLKRMHQFFDISYSDDSIRSWLFPGKTDGKYLAGDSRGWQLTEARKMLWEEDHKENIVPIAYRPFDTRWIYYHPKMVDWGRQKVMSQFLTEENLGLMTCRQTISDRWDH